MQSIRTASALMVLSLLAACGGAKDAASDSGAASMASADSAAASPMAAAPTVADFAGTWQVMSTLEGVAQPVPSTMTGSADGATWTISLEGRPNVPMQASMSGDSLVTQTAEYESVLRKGVMVTVRTASVMNNGAMTGKMIATYKTPTGTEVVNGTITGTRNP
ncbi:MAG TPA: hypothetical protein VE869_09565 [Gemmatimonas sp.]|nr:hypothetical protein [Gemmatimonas sp.]